MRTAIVQIPAFSESPWTDRLDQITSQSAPAGWTAEFGAWVTPNAPTLDACGTYQNAKNHPDVTVHEAPTGKLSTRNRAHAHAVQERGADVVVTWDADAPPITEHALAAILMPFDDPEVVATNGNPVSPGPVIGKMVNALGAVEDRIRPQMHGQLSSFTADAWRHAGPFPAESVDETKMSEVRPAEEFGFRQRLEQYGKIVDVDEAKVLNDTRRVEARTGKAFSRFTRKYPSGFHDDRRGKTFHPNDGEE